MFSQISNQLMHSMLHVHLLCTSACHVNLQHQTSLKYITYDGV